MSGVCLRQPFARIARIARIEMVPEDITIVSLLWTGSS